MEYTEILIPIRKIVRAIHLDSKKLQKECGLSIPQLLSLTFLSESEDYQCTQLELRKFLELNSSTVTGIVSRLVKKGLVAKIPSKKDKRTTQLTITTHGLKTLQDSPPLLQDRLLSRLDKLNEKELEQVQSGLKTLVRAIGAEEIDASPILTIPDLDS